MCTLPWLQTVHTKEEDDVHILDVILPEQNASSNLGRRDNGVATSFLNFRSKNRLLDLEDGCPEFARHRGIFRGANDNVSFHTLWEWGMAHIRVVLLILEDFGSSRLRHVAMHDCRALCLFGQVVVFSSGTVVTALRLNKKIELGDMKPTRERIVGPFLMKSETRVV